MRDGIPLQGLRYVSGTLAPYVGESVVIRYDPRDISEIRVFHHDEFVCKAVDPALENAAVSLKEIQAARRARAKSLREGINERIALVRASGQGADPGRPAEQAGPSGRASGKPRLKVYEED
jgi:putative transposase